MMLFVDDATDEMITFNEGLIAYLLASLDKVAGSAFLVEM